MEGIAGAPARVYLNEFVVPHLLEGMKKLVRERSVRMQLWRVNSAGRADLDDFEFTRPANPLEVLGRYLLQQSLNTEAGSTAATAVPTESNTATKEKEVKMEDGP